MPLLEARRLIFVDEMGMHCGMTRLFARAFRGERAVCAAPCNPGPNISVIGALGFEGLRAMLSIEGAVNSTVLQVFLDELLVPQLQSGDVVFMDNLPTHRSAFVREKIEAAGAQLIYLPSYSPDFSPIENYWGKLKTFLRAAAARTQEVLDQALTQALKTVTLQDIAAWFRHCGYEVTPN
jgi:transposase